MSRHPGNATMTEQDLRLHDDPKNPVAQLEQVDPVHPALQTHCPVLPAPVVFEDAGVQMPFEPHGGSHFAWSQLWNRDFSRILVRARCPEKRAGV